MGEEGTKEEAVAIARDLGFCDTVGPEAISYVPDIINVVEYANGDDIERSDYVGKYDRIFREIHVWNYKSPEIRTSTTVHELIHDQTVSTYIDTPIDQQRKTEISDALTDMVALSVPDEPQSPQEYNLESLGSGLTSGTTYRFLVGGETYNSWKPLETAARYHLSSAELDESIKNCTAFQEIEDVITNDAGVTDEEVEKYLEPFNDREAECYEFPNGWDEAITQFYTAFAHDQLDGNFVDLTELPELSDLYMYGSWEDRINIINGYYNHADDVNSALSYGLEHYATLEGDQEERFKETLNQMRSWFDDLYHGRDTKEPRDVKPGDKLGEDVVAALEDERSIKALIEGV